MPENRRPLGAKVPRRRRTRHRQLALAAALLLTGAVIGFTARCGLSALFVNVGNLAVLRSAHTLAASAFDTAAAVDPASDAARNFRLSQALVQGDYDGAADELAALRSLGGAPRGAASTSSVLLHLEAILARRSGESQRALALIRASIARAGVNAPDAALRLLDELLQAEANPPYGPALATIELAVDQRRDSCGDGRRLTRVRLWRNDIAGGGLVRAELEWRDAAGRPAGTDSRLVRNLAPNGAFTWGVTSAGLPLGFAAHPQSPDDDPIPSGLIYVGFADQGGQPVTALVMDNLDGPRRVSRVRSDWIPAAPSACYLFASEAWVEGGQPHFGLYLRAPGRADAAVFGLQGGLADGWRREARLLRMPPDIEAVQIFFWNYRSSGAAAFTAAVVARIDG